MPDRGDPNAKPVEAQATITAWRLPGAVATSAVLRAPGATTEARGARDPYGAAEDATAGLEPGQPLPVGAVIGERYVIEKHISSGGFGAVYLASDREIRHHQVALKLLHNPAASDTEREAALRELMLIATVSHPSVVQFKDYGWLHGRLWFAMPWYRGRTLDEVLTGEDGPVAMTRAEARPIFAQIAQGLAAMHEASVHHHDIKPENIFLAEIAGFPGGLPVLLDLGIATHRGENPRGLTVEYASPETAAAMLGVDVHVGAAADVFSLALVLRNALDPSAATPVMTDDVMPLLMARSQEPLDLPKRRDLAYLEPFFRRWLSLDPAERPTASELAEELAILTRPEEVRAARMRILRRVVPVVAVALMAIATLWQQVQRQETQISEQEREIQTQRLTQDELRKKAEGSLRALEARSSELGSERQRLQQALGIANDLNRQLEKANKENDGLERTLRRTRGERDTLEITRVALSAEREKLTKERNDLRAERQSLLDVQGRLGRERDDLQKKHEDAQARARELDQRVVKLETQSASLEEQLARAEAKHEKAARQRDEAQARQAELERKIKDLNQERKALETRVEKLEQSLDKAKRQLAKSRRAAGSAR